MDDCLWLWVAAHVDLVLGPSFYALGIPACSALLMLFGIYSVTEIRFCDITSIILPALAIGDFETSI